MKDAHIYASIVELLATMKSLVSGKRMETTIRDNNMCYGSKHWGIKLRWLVQNYRLFIIILNNLQAEV